jgi:NitT/TauT family transport system permease protein
MPSPRPPALARHWGAPRADRGEDRARSAVIDVVIVAGLAGLLYGLTRVGGEWTAELRPAVTIDLSPAALPRYAFFSFSRGLFAYVLSLGFTIVYGYWAAKDRLAERILVPLLDVLQSIPVLGFMPGLILALVALFPRSNVGLELAAVLMIFTGQAWNMTFSFYHSLRAVPREQLEVATLYGFGWWRTLRRVELPFAATGLVWNSMMSVAGGWFFLMITEAFVLGDKDFRLPGLGSYMSVAAARGDTRAMAAAMVTMVVMIVTLDQLVFRPLVVWAQKFRVEEGGPAETSTSWFFDLVRRSFLLPLLRRLLRRLHDAFAHASVPRPAVPAPLRHAPVLVSRLVFAALVVALAFGGYRLVHMFATVRPAGWASLFGLGLLTLARVVVATLLGTLWALPAGLAVGLSPRLSRVVQPVAQVLASFPAPMLFPAVIAGLAAAHVSLGWGSILLMLLGTQWYIFFNVIAGASSIPADLREVARTYHFSLGQRLRAVYLPAVFPSLVTGWVTATGGAWNASIVAEYVTFAGQVRRAPGLGAAISGAAERADFALLAAAVTVMSLLVVAWNRTVWHACYRLAETRFSLDK